MAASDQEDVYQLPLADSQLPESGLAPEQAGDAGPVIVNPPPASWRVINAGTADDVFTIHPDAASPIGAEYLLATEDTSNVVVKAFPVVPGDRPAWRFLPVSE
ncbi:hypothetical protein NRF20_12295 [Streptomyces sp. R-74717]|uniref:hypothetical protein n=1 Tax=Streptomyces TaxID=1883 RepID=UPI0037BE1D50